MHYALLSSFGHHGGVHHKYHAMLLLVPALIALEYGWHRLRGTEGYDLRESASTLLVAVGRFIPRTVSGLVRAPVFLWAYSHRIFTLAVDNIWAIIAILLVTEFAYYWFHRFSHAMRWMWASHSV